MNSDKYISLDVMNPGDAKLGQFYNMRAPCFSAGMTVYCVHGKDE